MTSSLHPHTPESPRENIPSPESLSESLERLNETSISKATTHLESKVDRKILEEEVLKLNALWNNEEALERFLDQVEQGIEVLEKYLESKQEELSRKKEKNNTSSESLLEHVELSPEKDSKKEAKKKQKQLKHTPIEEKQKKENRIKKLLETYSPERHRMLFKKRERIYTVPLWGKVKDPEKAPLLQQMKEHFSEGFWKGIKKSMQDFFEWWFLREHIQDINNLYVLKRLAEQKAKKVKEKVLYYKEKGKKISQSLRAKKEAEVEGAPAILKLKEAIKSFSTHSKKLLLELATSKKTPDEVARSLRENLKKLKQTNPEGYKKLLEKAQISARDLQKKAFLFELIRRTSDWYLHPKYRTKESLLEELSEALPIYGTYVAIRDLDDPNGLPYWLRYGFVGFNIALDALTIASFGFLTPATATIRTTAGLALKGAEKALLRAEAKTALKSGVQKAAKSFSEFSAKEFLVSLPKKMRKALLSSAQGKLLGGYALYSGLSILVDHLIDNYLSTEEILKYAAKKVAQHLTPQQRRLLSLLQKHTPLPHEKEISPPQDPPTAPSEN